MVVGIIIGAAIFVQPSEINRHVPTVPGVLSVWIAAGILTLCGALVCAQLSAAFPRTGGVHVFLKETLSPAFGFLWGWEHGPAPEESEGGREGLLEEDVDPAGARKGGGELGADQRAAEGEDAGGDPDGEHAGDGGDVAVDLRGLDEDCSADDDADHHGGGVEESDGAVGRGRQDGSECIMSADSFASAISCIIRSCDNRENNHASVTLQLLAGPVADRADPFRCQLAHPGPGSASHLPREVS